MNFFHTYFFSSQEQWNQVVAINAIRCIGTTHELRSLPLSSLTPSLPLSSPLTVISAFLIDFL